MATSMALASSATVNRSLASSCFSHGLKADLNAYAAPRPSLYSPYRLDSRSFAAKRYRSTMGKTSSLSNGVATAKKMTIQAVVDIDVGAGVSQREEAAVKKVERRGRGEMRLLSLSSLPLFLAATEVYWKPIETTTSTFTPSESGLKALYMVLSCAFCWGCVVFASMNDKFYDGDEYRNAGGNGTQYWIYEKEEEKEEEAREELWREELRREIEGRVTEVKELEGPSVEKEKELV